MAVTKMLHINHRAKLEQALQYIFDVEHAQAKTDGGRWIGGNAGMDPDTAYRRILNTKKRTGKESGRQAYHFILSFAKGETTPETAYLAVKDFCDAYLGDTYDHVFVIHTDREHLHGHIIFNSVSADGRKYHYKKGGWKEEIQPAVNAICREYGLSELDLSAEKRKTENGLQVDRTLTWKVLNREDIDYAIEKSDSYEAFLQNLKTLGYQIRKGYSEKRQEPYLAIRTQGMERSRRCYQLGKDYTVPNIRKRIASKEYVMQVRKDMIDHPAKQPLKGQLLCAYSPAFIRIQRIYLLRIGRAYRTYYRYTKPYPQAWKYKKDLIDMQKLIDRYNFLHQNHIESLRDLTVLESRMSDMRESLVLERNRLYRLRDRIRDSSIGPNDEETIEKISEEIRRFTAELKRITKEESLCKEIRLDNSNDNSREPAMEKGEIIRNERDKSI